MEYGNTLKSMRLEPVTGKAIPLKAGQTLHITLAEGPQCVDFNCFNLHVIISDTFISSFCIEIIFLFKKHALQMDQILI